MSKNNKISGSVCFYWIDYSYTKTIPIFQKVCGLQYNRERPDGYSITMQISDAEVWEIDSFRQWFRSNVVPSIKRLEDK